VEIKRRTLFENRTLQIGLVESRANSDACGDVERQSLNAISCMSAWRGRSRCGDDLTAIALDAGFASHSHFTARFRRVFGCTPAALPRGATAAKLADFRKTVTARAN